LGSGQEASLLLPGAYAGACVRLRAANKQAGDDE
jgi:hypothetical protein